MESTANISDTQLERLIIKSLFSNKEYAKRVGPFLDDKYVESIEAKTIVKKLKDHIAQYKTILSMGEFITHISMDKNVPEVFIDKAIKTLEDVSNEHFEEYGLDSLVDLTEHYFQEVVLSKAVLDSAEILASGDKKKKKYLLPEVFRDALKISFKNTVGSMYGDEDIVDRQYYYYTHREHKTPFPDWPILTGLLRGGASKKKIHVVLAGTGVGKCVYKDTEITIRNKKTGEIKTITIEEFNKMIGDK